MGIACVCPLVLSAASCHQSSDPGGHPNFMSLPKLPKLPTKRRALSTWSVVSLSGAKGPGDKDALWSWQAPGQAGPLSGEGAWCQELDWWAGVFCTPFSG